MRWVLIKLLMQHSGYSENAIRAKIKKGVWLEGLHWRKAPDGRIHFNLEAIQSWIEGKPVRA
ncbi:MAG TPA: excisionase family protein [Noviherbaspirillum sp.]|nr:excisionase family protein [Noviherbaspirillum sp.]